MRILIEEYQYEVCDVKEALHGIDPLVGIEGKVSVHYVGYYYNEHLRDCVFILPKVLLKGGENEDDGPELVFGKYNPRDIINLNEKNPLSDVERDFIYKLAVWVYRAIVVYKNDRDNDSSIVYYARIAEAGKGRRRLSNTYLDILLALLQFNRDNQSFFFFTLKSMHSGFNKINWTRTISSTPAIVQGGRPVYLRPVNKRRQVNFDEELLVIFFSILNYMGDTYGFEKEIPCEFDLITGKRFETYLKGYGKTRLQQIKYKYFSDKALELWELCFAFFKQSKEIRIHTDQREYLLVRNFYIVFEAIVDELIGDKPLPDGMQKKQEDGKIVDHLFTAKSLIDGEHRQTYYIGDSKYYKIGHKLTSESIYKQYTYARNVIQWNLDIFNRGDTPPSGIQLRDDKTEGYNIIPNFFISAKMDSEFRYNVDGLEQTDRQKKKRMQFQFRNRLFDRDTLLLFHYDVNFLFVLSLYARDNASQKARWKGEIRERFRQDIQEWLQEDYAFYAMRAHPGVDGERYIKEHFKDVLGKVFTPFDDKSIYSLALENRDEDTNRRLLLQLGQFFNVERCDLGTPPEDVLPEARHIVDIGAEGRDLVLVGYCKDKEQLRLVRKLGLYYVRAGMARGSLRLIPGFEQSRYVLLYNKAFQELYRLSDAGPRIVTGDDIRKMGFDASHDLYLVFDLQDNQPIVKLETEKGVFKIRKPRINYDKTPYFQTLEELIEPESLFVEGE